MALFEIRDFFTMQTVGATRSRVDLTVLDLGEGVSKSARHPQLEADG
jgi:hypothetical protein